MGTSAALRRAECILIPDKYVIKEPHPWFNSAGMPISSYPAKIAEDTGPFFRKVFLEKRRGLT